MRMEDKQCKLKLELIELQTKFDRMKEKCKVLEKMNVDNFLVSYDMQILI